jgi:hypothetical protein
MAQNSFRTYLEGRIVHLSNQHQEYKIEEGKADNDNRRNMMNVCASQIFEAKSEAEQILKIYGTFENIHLSDNLRDQQQMVGRLLDGYSGGNHDGLITAFAREQTRLENATLGLSMKGLVEPVDTTPHP